MRALPHTDGVPAPSPKEFDTGQACIDQDMIHNHCQRIHKAARSLADTGGKLIVASYGEAPDTGKKLKPIVLHYGIGKHERMTTDIIQLSKEPHRNVYMPLAIMRPDLSPGKKGGEDDIIGVLGLVADFDDERADRYIERSPISPTFVLETSLGRYQTFYIFNHPLAPQEAKKLAILLKKYAQCDHGTADISHVWRIPGTSNCPNRKKVSQGRPREPQLVRIIDSTGVRVNAEQLREKLQAKYTPTPTVANVTEGPYQGWDRDLDSLSLPDSISETIKEGASPGERSESLAKVTSYLISKCNLSNEDIAEIILSNPVGEKAREKHDPYTWLQEDIRRVRQHVEERQSPEYIIREMDLLHAAGNLSTDAWTELIINSRLSPIGEEAVLDHLVNINVGSKRPLKNELKERKAQNEKDTRQQCSSERLNREAGNRKLIEWKRTELNQMVRETEATIRTDVDASTVMLHGGAVSHVVTQAPTFAHRIGNSKAAPPEVPHIMLYSRESFTLRIDESVMFWRYGRTGLQLPIQVPSVLPSLMLNNPDSTFPVIQGLVPHPIVLQDGRFIEQEGYDVRSRLYLAFGGATFDPLKNTSDPVFIKTFALPQLMDLFEEFEFASKLDLYAAVAFLLTAISRKCIGTAPAVLTTANLQGSGKTTLVRIVYIIVTGHDLPVMTLSDSNEEVRKALTSALMSSPAIICFDNVPDGSEIRNPIIARLLTSTTLKDRLLGVNQEVSLPTNTTVVFTGNNISVDADSARRFLCIRLLPSSVSPEQRHFKNPDVISNSLRLRPKIISYALSLTQAFISACNNKDAIALELINSGRSSGFPEWDRMVRFPILWASGVDVLDAIERAKEESTEILARRGAIDALDEIFPDNQPFTAGDVKNSLTKHFPLEDADDCVLTLRNCLEEMNARALISSKSLGRVLKKLTDYPTKEGLVLRRRTENNQLKYSVERI